MHVWNVFKLIVLHTSSVSYLKSIEIIYSSYKHKRIDNIMIKKNTKVKLINAHIDASAIEGSLNIYLPCKEFSTISLRTTASNPNQNGNQTEPERA